MMMRSIGRFGLPVRIPRFSTAVYSQFHCQRDAAAACPPFNRDEVGSTPTAGANPGFVQRQDFRPITGESRFESSSLDQVDKVLLAAHLPRKQEDRVRP